MDEKQPIPMPQVEMVMQQPVVTQQPGFGMPQQQGMATPQQPGFGMPQQQGMTMPQQQGMAMPQPEMVMQQQATTNTIVVLQQEQQPQQRQFRQWSTGLCGCFEDLGSCCMGLFCPYFLLLDISSRLGEGYCFPCCCPYATTALRGKIRHENNIQGSLCDDYCVVNCCPILVLCQMSRELKSMGR